MKKWGAAVIGCGAISPVHVAAIEKSSHARLVAAADIDPKRAESFARSNQCEFTTDYRELLEREDIDAVHICTPHYLHGQMAADALLSGKHVLVEKPVALSVAEAENLQQIAEKQGKQIGVVFQNRYNEASRQIKKWLDEQQFGRLVAMRAFVTWHRDAAYYRSGEWRGKWATEGGGVLINQAIHTLDLLQWFGGEINWVKGAASNLTLQDVIEVEDTAHAILDFKSGARAVFFATNGNLKDSPIDLEIVCENATMIQRRDSLYLYQNGQETLICEPPMQENVGKSYWGIGHARCVEDFYEALAAGRPVPIGCSEGTKALKIVKAILGRAD